MFLQRFLTSHATRRAAAVAAMLSACAALLSGCPGQTYSCGTPSADHCYGTVTWKGAPTGLSMELTAVALTAGDIFVDDESWLIDYLAKGNPLNNALWVEAGEINEGFGTEYFWAENKTVGGFMYYSLGPVAQSDINTGSWIAYTIAQDTTPSSWNVTIANAGTGTVLYAAQSFNNPMTPNTVIEGQELAGMQNAQAPLAFFSENAVIQNGQTTIRTADGTVTANHPPNAGWLGTDTPSQTNHGGLFFTDCC
jgi:hypothetical protein